MLSRAKNIVDWLNGHVRKERWANSRLLEEFSFRGANEIIEDGTTCYMNPCLDYTLVILELLKANNMPAALSIEELRDSNKPFNRLHFAIETFIKQAPYVVDVFRRNQIVCYSGNYQHMDSGKPGFERVKLARYPGSRIDPNKSIYESLGVGGPEGLTTIFKGYRLAPQLQGLLKDNTQETYEAFLEECDHSRLWLADREGNPL